MIKSRRLWGISAVLGGAVLLGGCVAVPGSYGYSDPYYVDPGPAVVQPNVYIDGGYSGGYYSRPRYPAPYYYGRPGQYPHPGYRPGWNGRPGPGVALPSPPPPPGAGPRTGVAGNIVPVPPGRSRQEINRMLSSPDSRNQTPP